MWSSRSSAPQGRDDSDGDDAVKPSLERANNFKPDRVMLGKVSMNRSLISLIGWRICKQASQHWKLWSIPKCKLSKRF
jgi:hypothetical protein